ncbi:MAG: hypothetical protein WC389_18700 [Lutibacter sp.]|jgi:hypothetical protein
MPTLANFKTSDIDFTEMLKGEIHETRRFIITSGQSEGSKDVMFVMYSIPKVFTKYAKDTYLGNLAIDLDEAILKARKKIGRYLIEIDVDELCGSRRQSNTFPFGKYSGKTAAEVFDIDPKYLFWASKNMYVKSKLLADELSEYGELSKILILEENEKNTNPALPVDTVKVERKLTIVSNWETEWGMAQRLVDSENNIFQYDGKQLGNKGDKITISCKVTKNWTSMGKVINKINLR